MFLNDLLEKAYITQDEVQSDEILIVPAHIKAGMEHNMVVARTDFESIIVKYRASEPSSEAICMAIGKVKTNDDPIWNTLLAIEGVNSKYIELSNIYYAEQLEKLENTENPVELPGVEGIQNDVEETVPENTPKVENNESGSVNFFVPPIVTESPETETEMETPTVSVDVEKVTKAIEEMEPFSLFLNPVAFEDAGDFPDTEEPTEFEEDTEPTEFVPPVFVEPTVNNTPLDISEEQESTEEILFGDNKPDVDLAEAELETEQKSGGDCQKIGKELEKTTEEESLEDKNLNEVEPISDSDDSIISEDDIAEQKVKALSGITNVCSDATYLFKKFGVERICASCDISVVDFFKQLVGDRSDLNKRMRKLLVEGGKTDTAIFIELLESIKDIACDMVGVADYDGVEELLSPIMHLIYKE